MLRRFSNFIKFGLPARFRTGDGELVQGTIAMMIDASMQRLREITDASLPTRAGDSALALHGLDRGIRRGRTEAAAHYAQRLLRWRWPRGHRVRGGDWGLLEQVAEYFGGMYAATIDARGNVYARAVDGTLDWAFGTSWNWDGAGASPRWARFWVAVDPSGLNGTPGTAMSASPAFGDPALWGGSYGDPAYSVGIVGITPDDVAAIRELMGPPFPWKMAGTRSEWLLVNVTGTAGFPDGTWGTWSKNLAGVQVPTRFAGWRYVSLAPSANNAYEGNPESFATSVTLPGGGLASGDSTSFPTSVTLPDGTVYAGNARSFLRRVQLVDDGSQP